MSLKSLVVFVTALFTLPAVAQEKVIASGEYGHFGANGPVAMEDEKGKWTATDGGNGNVEIHHKKGQMELSYTLDAKGIPVASKMSSARDGKEVFSVSCEFHPTSMECTDELTKKKTSLGLKKSFVFVPALEGSDTFLMLIMLASGAEKSPGKQTDLAGVGFEDRSDNELRLVSTEAVQVKYLGRKDCQTPIGTIRCHEVSFDDMLIRIADSGLILSTGPADQNSMELISIQDDSHRLLPMAKNQKANLTKK